VLFLKSLLLNLRRLVLLLVSKSFIIPLMEPEEILLITHIIRKTKPMKCLEWGVGGSTLYFPSKLEKKSKWISIEHNKSWSELIQKLIENDQRNEVHYVLPNSYPWTDSFSDGSDTDLQDYIEFPSRFGKFDLIFIDGRARVPCLKKALTLLNPNGAVILHDAGREHYHLGFDGYKHSLLFTGSIPGMGIWIGTNDENLLDKINSRTHEFNWLMNKKLRDSMVYQLLTHQLFSPF